MLFVLVHFNSIKVRLEPNILNAGSIKLKFQFHKGTIRTVRLLLGIIVFSSFQFHKGTIRTDLSHRHMFTAQVFQFHTGRTHQNAFASKSFDR